MTQPAPTPNKGGRPAIPDDQKLVVGGVRLTREQWDQYKALGGADWLRETIKRAWARRQKA